MFIERNIGGKGLGHAGWIEVIAGSMFSGKTEELIRRLNRAFIAQQVVEIFKPIIDSRYSKSKVVSHNKTEITSTPVHFSRDILLQSGHCEVIGIDEAQFFDEGIVEVAKVLADSGKRVIVAGLDMDFRGVPFEPMDKLMAVAEYVTKVHAVCMSCGDVASFSHRRTKSQKTVVLGEKDIYEALCRRCFNEKTR